MRGLGLRADVKEYRLVRLLACADKEERVIDKQLPIMFNP